MVTLYCIVEGPIYERYWQMLERDAQTYFFPGEAQLVRLPGIPRGPERDTPPQWSHISATRYEVALANLDKLGGDYIFQIDADMRIVAPVGSEILCDGITTSIHPGVPPEQDKHDWPYERRPESRAYVPYGGEGPQYHPGCFIGGRRAEFLALAEIIRDGVRLDLDQNYYPAWYEESHLNKYFIDHPADLVLPKQYCWWAHYSRVPEGADPDLQAEIFRADGAIVAHLDKTGEEFRDRG